MQVADKTELNAFENSARRGFRNQDREYSLEYCKALTNWMHQNNQWDFEEKLIAKGFVSLELKNVQLGLDFIVETLTPSEDMAFESNVLRYVPLDPDDQLVKRYKNEIIRQEKRERWLSESDLSKFDVALLSDFGAEPVSSTIVSDRSTKNFRIPEPPYAEVCRNPPPDLRISRLRQLREDGYFDALDIDVQIAAYLIAKGHWQEERIKTIFSAAISWERFQSAQAKVHKIISAGWPKRFARVEGVLNELTPKQYKAFETRYDIDIRPTLKMAAKTLKIDVSSLKERLQRVGAKIREEFTEFKGLKRRPFSWSRASDILLGGFFRQSLAFFRKGSWQSISIGNVKFVSSSTHDANRVIRTPTEVSAIRQWLDARSFRPEAKAILAGSSRGGYRVKRGEFFHHSTENKMTEFRLRLEMEGYSHDEIMGIITATRRKEPPTSFDIPEAIQAERSAHRRDLDQAAAARGTPA